MKQTVKGASFQSMTLIARLLYQPPLEMVYVALLVSALAQLARGRAINSCQNIFFWSQSSLALQFILPLYMRYCIHILLRIPSSSRSIADGVLCKPDLHF